MRERTILAVFIQLQESYYRRKQYNRGFYEKVSLLLHPRLIEVKHDGVRRFVSIRNIRHQLRCQWITTVAFPRIIEIDHIKFRWNLITVSVLEQMVVSDNRQVIKLKIIYIERIGFLYSLLYKLVDNGIGLPAARCSQYHCRPKNINKVDKSVVSLPSVPEFGRQIDGIFVFHKAGFLHERFILGIENVLQ